MSAFRIMSNHERISLLTNSEIEELYSRPKFNETERDYYFSLNENDHEFLIKYKSIKSKLYFILQLGYFRATMQFYCFSIESVNEDVSYLRNKYFSSYKKEISGTLWKENNRQQKSDILDIHQYKEWSSEFKPMMVERLEKLVRLYPKGNDTLREFFILLENQKITIPSYRTIQDLFTIAFTSERNRLDKIMLAIEKDLQEKLDNIIKNDNGLSQLNIIRTDQKDFKYQSLKAEIKKAKKLDNLYKLSQSLIPTLLISNNAVRYYALIAEQYSASRIRKLEKPQQWLHILCFVFYRYKEFMDNLISSFLFHMRSLMDDAKIYAEKKEEEYLKNLFLDFPKLGIFLKWFSSNEISPNISYKELSQIGFNILPKEKQASIADFISGISFDRKAAKWEFYESSFRRIAMYLRPILLTVNFEFYKSEGLLLDLIKTLRDHYGTGKTSGNLISALPDELFKKIPKIGLDMLQENNQSKRIHPARFEFYVYEKMRHQIDRGRLFCNSSVSYCSLDDDLVSDEMVDKADEIADEFGYKKIPIYCDERLDQALSELDSAWERTNSNIDAGYNRGIKIQVDDNGLSTWQLLYDAETTKESNFFMALSQRDIADIMKLMGDKLNIWPVFIHLKGRYAKYKNPDPLVMLAGILSDAFGFGIKKMADISNVAYNHLLAVHENFIYTNNLYKANDVVSDYIHSLPASRAWDLKDNTIIADADGQKFETSRHTIQSRYSSKYFGTYKGVSVYTLVANHIPVNSKVIGPNEHESHHLYDILYGNASNVSIDMVTGDNHSINQANFVVLDSIDIEFIPSIKNIRSEAEKIYSVKEPSQYNGLIKPCGKINTALIKSEKRGIIRILLSLLLQENTQAVIIRKLSSHKRYSRLRAALWEYNKIFKSIHVLNLINDMQLRKAIKTARNRTESYHQMQRTIRKTYSGVFKGKKIVDNAVSNQASRFVANCVIAYNAMLLDQVYQRLIAKYGEETAKSMIAKISPVAWQHIIFTGRYDFKSKPGEIDLDRLVEILEQNLSETRQNGKPN